MPPPKKQVNAHACEHVNEKNFRKGLCYPCWRLENVSNEKRKLYNKKHYVLKRSRITIFDAFKEKFTLMFASLPPQPAYVTKLWNHYVCFRKKPVTCVTSMEEVACLLQHVQFSEVLSTTGGFMDPFCGTHNIGKALREQGFTDTAIVDLDIKLGFDAINPSSWQLVTPPKPLCIVTSPPWELLDYCIADLSTRCQVLAVHVSSDYSTNYPAHRQQWFAEKEEQELVTRVTGLPRVEGRRRAVWIVVFKDKETKSACWKAKGNLVTCKPVV